MTIHVIASGDTGAKWPGTGPSIGVNDAWKWGHPTDYLVLLNTPNQFQSSRLEVIKKSTPNKIFSNVPSSWDRYFDNTFMISPMRRWNKGEPVKKSIVYHSNTSPFVAVSLAYSWGFNKIILWGVDMVTHHRYGKGQPAHVQEMMKYQSYFNALREKDVQIMIGSEGTAFDHMLPVWNRHKVTA